MNTKVVNYFCALAKNFVLVTTNKEHPAYNLKHDNLRIFYQEELNLRGVLEYIYNEFSCERITIQSGGTLNGLFLREKLFDYIDIVAAPVLIGGKDTSTLIGGSSIVSPAELEKLGVLSLEKADVLEGSYIKLLG